jgi:hypothetical protein
MDKRVAVSALLGALNLDVMSWVIGRKQERGMNNPFFVPVTHIAPVINTFEGVALIGLATLLGVALALVVEGMARRLR